MRGDNKSTALATANCVRVWAANFRANMNLKGEASVITGMVEWEDAVAMVCFTLCSTWYANILTPSYLGQRRNKQLSNPRGCLRQHYILLHSHQGRYLRSPDRRGGWKTPVTTSVGDGIRPGSLEDSVATDEDESDCGEYVPPESGHSSDDSEDNEGTGIEGDSEGFGSDASYDSYGLADP